jgi:membrane peptidoglycan carboxypeptidase
MSLHSRFIAMFSRTPQNSRPPKRPFPWKRAGKILLWVLGVGFVVGFFLVTIALAWVSRDLPDPNTLSTREVPQSTRIYDRTGQHLLYEIHGDEKRTLIKIADLPRYVPMATVSIEDRKFYEHHGIYWKGLIRAVVMSVVRGQRIQGTSTLTQQLVKNAILTNERSLLRKMKEFILSLQIERVYNKDQILQLYLNEIPYGSNIYGIESAAETYFGKPARELTLDEAALLAAIPQAPDLYSPYGTGAHGDNRDRLVVRQRYILDLLAEQNYVSKADAEAAKQIKTLEKLKPKQLGNIEAPHFVMYVRSLLVDKYGQKQVEQGGLKVVTTLDWDKEQVAEREVKKGVEARGKDYKFTNAALVSLDPKTGQILAMVGSKDFFDAQHDGQVNIILRPRQPGSSFKPIVYALAFSRGFLPQTQLWDVTTNFRTETGNYTPNDYDFKERGPVTLRQSLQGSLNIPAVQLIYLNGVGRTLDLANALGYTTLDDRSRFGLSLALGSGEVKPLEHASAFATFANDGVSLPTSAILRVENSDGTLLDEWQPPEGKRVIDSQTVRQLSNVLSDTAARQYIFGSRSSYLALPDRQVAAKTGTTNSYKDAWTVGYTPNLVTVVWAGNSDGTDMKQGADGSIIAAPIWNGYMKEAVKGLSKEHFQDPAPSETTNLALLGQVFFQKLKVDRVSGKLATEFTPPDMIEERSFVVPHSILYFLDKDDLNGPAPTNPGQDPQFENWERAIQTWLPKSPFATSTAPTTYDDVHTAGAKPQVTIISPQNNQTIPSRMISIQPSIASARPLVRVEASIDNNLIATAAAAPWSMTGSLPNFVQNGSAHTLTVVAIDDAGNRGETDIQIQYQEGSGGSLLPSLPILAPTPTVAIEGQRPLVWSSSQGNTVDLRLSEGTQYTRIDLSLVNREGIVVPLTSVVPPFQDSMHIPIGNTFASGSYTLHVAAVRSSGNIDTTDASVSIP